MGLYCIHKYCILLTDKLSVENINENNNQLQNNFFKTLKYMRELN